MSLHYGFNLDTKQLKIVGQGLVKGDDLYSLHQAISQANPLPAGFTYQFDTRGIYNLDLWDSDAMLLAFGDPFPQCGRRKILVANDRFHAILKSYISALARYNIRARLTWETSASSVGCADSDDATGLTSPWSNQLAYCA